jgi:hypothetical protein
MIERIADNMYLVREGEAVITFNSKLEDDFDKGKTTKITPPGGGGPIEIMYWGKDNDLPQQRELLVGDNNVVPSLLERKRNILMGSGLVALRHRFEPLPTGGQQRITEEVEMPSQVQAWLDGEGWANGSNFHEYMAAACGEWVKHSLVIPEFVRLRNRQISSIEVKECKYMRAEKKDQNGRIQHWFWSGHWPKNSNQKNILEEKKTVRIPVYQPGTNQAKFVKPFGDSLLNDGYYPIPVWWGGWEWIELANQIPQFHKNNIANGYNLRWHIQVPADYFLDYEKWQEAATSSEKAEVLKDQAAREQAFMDDVNTFLSGVTNAGRTLFTKYELDKSLGREYPGIKISGLSYDMKDEALLKLFERSNTANTSAQGIHPSLAGIETQGKLSSGTEIRNAFLMWLIINTPLPRRMILSPLEIVKRENNWPADITFGIRDYELTALSTDPSGMQESAPQ